MALRLIDDNIWVQPFIIGLDADGKTLYHYCISNPHQKPHGVFQAIPEEVGFFTGIAVSKIEELLGLFAEKGRIKWMKEIEKIWLKEFLLTQTRNPMYIKGVIANLKEESPGFIGEYIEYYENLGFWTKYSIDLRKVGFYIETYSEFDRNIWHAWAKKTYPELTACRKCGATTNLARHCPNHDYRKRDGCDILCGSCHPAVSNQTIQFTKETDNAKVVEGAQTC